MERCEDRESEERFERDMEREIKERQRECRKIERVKRATE